MGNLNKVLLIGKLGQDPEKKVTPQGNSVVTLSLATSERYKDKSGNQQEKTEWHRIVFWNQAADTIEKYCKKGSSLYIEGKLQTREWTDKDQNKRWTTEVIGSQFQFLDSKPQGQQNQQGGYQQPQQNTGSGGVAQNGSTGQNPNNFNQGQQNPQPNPSNDFVEDDIPF